MTQSARAVRDNLHAAMVTLYADFRDGLETPAVVTLGRPTTYQPNVIIAVAQTTQQRITRPTMGSTRSREREVDVTVTFSVYVPASENDQVVAMDTCDDLVDMLETYIRTSPNEKLSGACRDSFVSAIDGPTPDVITHPDSGQVTGRVAEAIVTVTAFCRY